MDHPENPNILFEDPSLFLSFTQTVCGYVRSVAASSYLKVIKRFPSLAKGSMLVLMSSLQDAGAAEESVLGACQILSSRSMIRHILQVTCY